MHRVPGYPKFYDEIARESSGLEVKYYAKVDSAREICFARTTVPTMYKIDPEWRYFRDILGPRFNEKG